MDIRAIFLLTLAVSGCSASDSSSLIEGIGKRLPQPLQNVLHEYLENEHLSELNGDAILSIFDKLEFSDLLRVAEMSKGFSFLAAKSFAKNFAHTKISIGNFSYSEPPEKNQIAMEIQRASKKINRFIDSMNLDNFSGKKDFTVNDDSIQIQSVFLGLKTLKYFGKHIQRLELWFENANSTSTKILSKYVDDYCSDTLVELKLQFNEGDALGNFKNTFNHVEKLEFDRIVSHEMAIMPTNKTFPALRSFSLRFYGCSENYENGYFPHLEHLSIINSRAQEIDMLKDLLNANANIRSFECSVHCDPALLHYASARLLNVENLVLDDFYVYNSLGQSQIHFDNVTKAKLYSKWGVPLISSQILLPKLQDLEIGAVGLHGGTDTLLDFLDRNSKLSRLHLVDGSNFIWRLDADQLNMILSKLPHLEELSISNRGENHIDGETIIMLLANHPKLMKFKTDVCSRDEEKMLRDNLDEKWHIENYYNGLSFERKC